MTALEKIKIGIAEVEKRLDEIAAKFDKNENGPIYNVVFQMAYDDYVRELKEKGYNIYQAERLADIAFYREKMKKGLWLIDGSGVMTYVAGTNIKGPGILVRLKDPAFDTKKLLNEEKRQNEILRYKISLYEQLTTRSDQANIDQQIEEKNIFDRLLQRGFKEDEISQLIQQDHPLIHFPDSGKFIPPVHHQPQKTVKSISPKKSGNKNYRKKRPMRRF